MICPPPADSGCPNSGYAKPKDLWVIPPPRSPTPTSAPQFSSNPPATPLLPCSASWIRLLLTPAEWCLTLEDGGAGAAGGAGRQWCYAPWAGHQNLHYKSTSPPCVSKSRTSQWSDPPGDPAKMIWSVHQVLTAPLSCSFFPYFLFYFLFFWNMWHHRLALLHKISRSSSSWQPKLAQLLQALSARINMELHIFTTSFLCLIFCQRWIDLQINKQPQRSLAAHSFSLGFNLCQIDSRGHFPFPFSLFPLLHHWSCSADPTPTTTTVLKSV